MTVTFANICSLGGTIVSDQFLFCRISNGNNSGSVSLTITRLPYQVVPDVARHSDFSSAFYMDELAAIGSKAAAIQIKPENFPQGFD
jgi:hypothetical protein